MAAPASIPRRLVTGAHVFRHGDSFMSPVKPPRGRFAIQNGDVVLPDRVESNGTVLIEDGRIRHAAEARETPRGFETVDAGRGWVCPGLIELHFHGVENHSFEDLDPDGFRRVADALMERGVLRFVPTMMSSEKTVAGVARLIEDTGLAGRALGLYVEGPFVNVEKRGGIQSRYIHSVDLARLERFQDLARGRMILMAFAPELEGAERLPAAMRRLGVIPCVGHSLASSGRAREVAGRGKVNVTHLFNAMSGLDHRSPGVASFALNHGPAYVELNADGRHAHPELVDLAWRAKRGDRLVLITDAVISAGSPEGRYDYMGRSVVARPEGVFYEKEGTLVGSRILLNEAIVRFRRFTGAAVHEAVRLASLHPATLLGLHRRKGSLEAGKDADVVVFARNFGRARAVFIEGERAL